MADLKFYSDKLLKALNDNKATKAVYSVVESEKREFTVEGNSFTLLRTLFDRSANVSAWDGDKRGDASCNDFSDEALNEVVVSALSAARSSDDDPCKDFAPSEGVQSFSDGAVEPDIDRFFARIKEFKDTLEKEYPLIKVMTITGLHKKGHTLFRTTRGTEFDNVYGYYSFSMGFSANNGEKGTGMAGVGFATSNLDTPFMEQAGSRVEIQRAIDSLNEKPFEGKLEGPVIFTPGCLAQMFDMTCGSFLNDSAILDGTSLWLDKLDKKVMSDKINIVYDPHDERLACSDRYNSDGFIVERTPFIEKGVLKSQMLGLYVANKTGKPVSKITGGCTFFAPGDVSFDDMVKGIKKGVMVGDVSCGTPGSNGEFSGVAKNAFLIEDGKIKHALSETMISGNLSDVFNNVRCISKETVEDGYTSYPYLCVESMVISGK